MSSKEAGMIPSLYEVSKPIPGTEGWERMYPVGNLIWKERIKELEEVSIYRDVMHWPRALTPFDTDCIFIPAFRGLDAYQHRITVTPVGRGFYFFLINGYQFSADVPVYTDPKVIEERTREFMRRMIYCWFNWKWLYSRWKKDVLELLKEQESLGKQIRDLPEPYDDMEIYTKLRAISSGRKLVEIFDRAVHIYLTIFEGYQYQFIGAAYATDFVFIDFCKKAFPGIDEQTIGRMITGVELEAYRPDEEVKRLARLAVKLGLAADIKKATNFEKMRSEFEKTRNGRKWCQEFDKVSFPWFNMMVTQGVFARHDEPCWIENPDIILGFLKNYIEKIERGEKIERDVKALKAEKARLFKEHLEKLKTDEEKKTFKQYYDLATTFYVFVEEEVMYIKNFNYALFRRNIKKFAEILAKRGIIKEPNDIFFLQFKEIKSALEDLSWSWAAGIPPTNYWIREIEWRKKVFEKFEKWEPPMFVGPWKKGVEEPFALILGGGVPPHILDLYRRRPKPEELKELTGHGVSPGVVEGPARVIKRPEDIDKLQLGEIMVCPHTQPAWTPAFAVIKGIVCDSGGVMSHAGITAREYGIPGVMNTHFGTSVIKTGDKIRVDGDKGVVTILG